MSNLNTLVKFGIYLGIPSLALIFYLLKKSKEEKLDEGSLFWLFFKMLDFLFKTCFYFHIP